MPYLFMAITLLGAVVSQLLLRRGLLAIGQIPQSPGEFIPFFVKVFTNFYVLSAVSLWVIAALAWILAASKAEISHIYPIMGLSFVLVTLLSWLTLGENVTLLRWAGVILVCIGVVLVAKS